MTPLGWVGLGQIGRPMAERLLDWPHGLMVHDVVPDVVAGLVESGASAATDLAQVGQRCQLVHVMVRDDDQVREVVDGLAPNLAPTSVIAIHSTIGPDTAAELATAVAPRGVAVVDAPVSGGPIGAATGRLAIMLGGTDDAVARVRPAMERLGDLVVHVGPVGAGTAAKLARNLIHFAAFAAVGEAARLADAAGVDLVTLGDVVRHSDAVTGGPGAIMHRDTAAPVTDDDPWLPILAGVHHLGDKDLRFAIALADSLGVDTPVARTARAHLAHALGLPSVRDAEA